MRCCDQYTVTAFHRLVCCKTSLMITNEHTFALCFINRIFKAWAHYLLNWTITSSKEIVEKNTTVTSLLSISYWVQFVIQLRFLLWRRLKSCNRPESIECPCPSQMSFYYLKSLMFHQSLPIVVTLKVTIILMLTIIQSDSIGPPYRVSHPKNNHFLLSTIILIVSILTVLSSSTLWC